MKLGDLLLQKDISVSRGITRVPRHLQVTPTMVDDFLIDPVMGAYVIMGEKLDVFQACALRLMWWTPNMIDSSAFGTGKSRRLFVFLNLRAAIIGDQHEVVYFQTFEAMKNIFWDYYRTFDSRRCPIFTAQLGKVDAQDETAGKDNSKGPACYKQYFKNESVIFGPAPGWFQDAKTQAGATYNVAAVDEWTKAESMTRKTGRTINETGNTVGGISQQILGRVRRASWNQYHPLWGNRMVFLATAESLFHPAARRYKTFLNEIKKGDPNYAVFTASFKDFSNIKTESDIRIEDCSCKGVQPAWPDDPKCPKCKGDGRILTSSPGKVFKEVVPNWMRINSIKVDFMRSHFLREALGIWARETAGWYSEDALERCVAKGFNNNLQPEIVRSNTPDTYYFEGIDPAPAMSKTADDGAMVILRVRPRPGLTAAPSNNASDWQAQYVWAYRVRGKVNKAQEDEGIFVATRTREWSGLIHEKNQHFGLSGILMDTQGGGQQIHPELSRSKQIIGMVSGGMGVETECTPIATVGDSSVVEANFILSLLLREYLALLWPELAPGVDSTYNAMHTVFQEVIHHAEVEFPLPFNDRPSEQTASWPVEMKWALKNLDTVRSQLLAIQVAMLDTGGFDTTRNGAKQFKSGIKKDLAYAAIMAYIRFLIWLKMGEREWAGDNDDAQCYT